MIDRKELIKNIKQDFEACEYILIHNIDLDSFENEELNNLYIHLIKIWFILDKYNRN